MTKIISILLLTILITSKLTGGSPNVSIATALVTATVVSSISYNTNITYENDQPKLSVISSNNIKPISITSSEIKTDSSIVHTFSIENI